MMMLLFTHKKWNYSLLWTHTHTYTMLDVRIIIKLMLLMPLEFCEEATKSWWICHSRAHKQNHYSAIDIFKHPNQINVDSLYFQIIILIYEVIYLYRYFCYRSSACMEDLIAIEQSHLLLIWYLLNYMY